MRDVNLIASFVRFAHANPSHAHHVSGYIQEALSGAPSRLKLATLCISDPAIFARLSHLVDFGGGRVASEGEYLVRTLFRLASGEQQKAKARGITLRKTQNRAPKGEGKKTQRFEDKHDNPMDYVMTRLPKYQTLSPHEKGTITKKIKVVLRGGDKISKSPIARRFMEQLEKAKDDTQRVKVLKQWARKAERLREQRLEKSEKKSQSSSSNSSGKNKPKSNKPKSNKPSKPKGVDVAQTSSPFKAND